MRKSLNQLVEAIDHRTGLHTALRHFLYEEIPASSGWHQVFGSVALFLFLIQFFTGIMLALNYAPTSGDAYSSVRYIMTEVTQGSLMRGLHHWGASIIVIVVVMHMVQVFLWGAYKKPREGTWIVGCILLLLTLGFALTGYLLPWDNRAYFGTSVTVRIAALPPGGQYVSRLLGTSGGDLGVVTFARFFSAHVLLLPPLAMILIALHVILVRRHGVAPAPDDADKPKKSFFPEQVFKDTVAVFVVFVILFVMSIAVRVPLEHVADPTDTAYIPRPEWYFLFLFQFLKAFPGPLEVVGAVFLPTLAILALILTPFIDRRQMAKLRQRTLAFGVVVLAALGWGGLTLAAVKSTPPPTAAEQIDYSGSIDWMSLTPPQMAGIQYYKANNCAMCHNVTDGPAKMGPNLVNTARRHDDTWLQTHFKNPEAVAPNTTMPQMNLTDPQIRDLVALMKALTPDNSDVIETAPEFALAGAALFEKSNCAACHTVNGVGGKIGPSLNGESNKRTETWVIEHFQNPKKMVPGSVMPAYPFSGTDMQNEVSYLFTLPDKTPGQ